MSQWFLVYRKWRIQATNKWEAIDKLLEAIEGEYDKDFLVSQWAKEEPGGSWTEDIKKQLGGK